MIIHTFLYAHNGRYIVTTILTNEGEYRSTQYNSKHVSHLFKREYSCCHLVSNLKAEWKENEKR